LVNFVHYNLRDWRACIDDMIEIKRLFPRNGYARINLVLNLSQLGKQKEAEEELATLRPMELSGDEREFLATAFAYCGRPDESRNLLKELEASRKAGYSSPVSRAYTYAALGEKDRALVLLEKAFADIPAAFLFHYRAPVFDSLRSNPRFVALVSKLNLPRGAWPLFP